MVFSRYMNRWLLTPKQKFLTRYIGWETPGILWGSLTAGRISRLYRSGKRCKRVCRVKFYTEDGNFDLVGNNMPVFCFIQDAHKFPDLVHAVKARSHLQWDTSGGIGTRYILGFYLTNAWVDTWSSCGWWATARYSTQLMHDGRIRRLDICIPADKWENEMHFAIFHRKPSRWAVHSVAWDEAHRKYPGKDPDYHRPRSLGEAIENGVHMQWISLNWTYN